MKKCPFCAEEIQDEAIICKHCKSHLDAPMPVATAGKFYEFEHFMATYSQGWVLTGKSDSTMSYQKIVPPSKGDCATAFFLLWLGVVPGLLYLYFANQPGTTHVLTVSLTEVGGLMPTGDQTGLSVFNAFQKYLKNPDLKNPEIKIPTQRQWYYKWWAIMIWIFLTIVFLTLIAGSGSSQTASPRAPTKTMQPSRIGR
jgi:hypothetical protein